jgi:pathogenicity locus Cdd1 protein
MKTSKASTDMRKLRDLAGIGKSIEANLNSIGVTSVPILASREGDDLYDKLCAKTRTRQDSCVLDTFRCAVAQARNPRLPTEKCNWWWWSRQRKAGKL